MEGEEYVIVKIDFHDSKHTEARTFWRLPKNSKRIHTTATKGKTHWVEFHIIPRSSTLTRVRVSNRGNVSTYEYTGESIKYIEASKEEIEMLKALGKL